MSRLLALLAALALAATPAMASDIVDLLERSDLVVEGRLVQAVQTKKPLLPADAHPNPPGTCVEFEIAVDRTWAGVAGAPAVKLTSRNPYAYEFAGGAKAAGTRVIAFAERQPGLGFEPWGDVFVVAPDGRVDTPPGYGDFASIRDFEGDPRVTVAQLDSLYRSRIAHSGAHAFDGAHGVLVVRLGARTVLPNAGLLFRCDSLGWAIPTQARAPRRLRFTPPAECNAKLLPGDTLLVPVRLGDADSLLEVGACARAWQVRNGRTVGFGTTLAGLASAFDWGGDGLVVRPVLGLDPRFQPPPILVPKKR